MATADFSGKAGCGFGDRSAERTKRDMIPIRVLRMGKPQLFVGGICDRHANAGDITGFGLDNLEPCRVGIDHHETIASIGCIDKKCSKPFDLKRDRDLVGEAGDILNKDTFRFAVPAFGSDANEASGGLPASDVFRVPA